MGNTGKIWTKKDINWLEKNYLTKKNQQLSDYLKRSKDAVRKRLNAMGLKRPTQHELKKMDKKVLKDREIFKSLKTGVLKRKKRKKNVDHIDKLIKVRTKKTPPTKKQPSELVKKVPIYVNARTTLWCIPGKEKETLGKYRNYLAKKKTKI